MVKSRKHLERPYNQPIDVLILCTANQCRSPMAEALLRQRLAAAGVEARVSSAGTYEGGAPATGHGIEVMAGRGLDLTAHVSRRVDTAMVAEADLVIGLAKEHVREAAVLASGALAKSFTLKELALLAGKARPRRDDEDLRVWLERIGAARDRDALIGTSYDAELDVEDPVGGDLLDYEVTAELVDELLAAVVARAFPSRPRVEPAR